MQSDSADAGWLPIARAAVSTRLPAFTAPDLSLVAWSLATLSPNNDDTEGDPATLKLMDRVLAQVRPNLHRLEGRALGSVVWACGKLGMYDIDAFLDAAMELIVEKPRLLPPREICTCLWALGQLQYRAPTKVRPRLLLGDPWIHSAADAQCKRKK